MKHLLNCVLYSSISQFNHTVSVIRGQTTIFLNTMLEVCENSACRIGGFVTILLVWIAFPKSTIIQRPKTHITRNHPVCEDNQPSSSSIGCILPSLTMTYEPSFPGLATDMAPCPYLTDHYTRADCSISGEIKVLGIELLHPTDVVLEIGGRYGTVSCAVALAQNNSGQLITNEAASDVWAIH
jgi:hypothetical protein